MRSFLGVPIIAGGEVIGAFYLTEKETAPSFDATDGELISLLAAHAAIAITNARLYERSRELSILSERNRLALELHDVVSQKLFSLTLTAQAAAAQFDRDPQAARAHLERLGELASEALEELRALILGLRPPALERDGLRATLAKELDMLALVHQVDIRLAGDGELAAGEPERDLAVLRIVGEAVHNALAHARAGEIVVRIGSGAVEVLDDGCGFDPDALELRSRHLGLTSMEERARELGASLTIDTAPGEGTVVRLAFPESA
jgi:signal transduction histidine kinase